MANTYVDYTGDGSNDTFSITFPYLSNTHVNVLVGGVTKTEGTHYNISTGNIVFTSGNIPASATAVKVERVTERITPLVDFKDGSTLLEADLDTSSRQSFYISQETDEVAFKSDSSGNYDASNNKLVNVGTPTAGTDGATKQYVDDQILTKDNLDEIAEGTTNKHLTSTLKDKLDAIESSATADQTGAEIKAAYEGEADTNAFTDADHSKLNGIEASATADQTGSEIKSLYESESDTNAFTDADHTKLDGIAAGAIANVAEDTTPQLGGDLDVNGQDIVSTSNADIEIAPNGTGKTVFKGNTNAGKITLNCESNSHGVSLASPAHSSGADYTLTLPTSVGTSGQVLSTDGTAGTAALSWVDSGGSASDLNGLSDVTITSPASTEVLTYNGSAWVNSAASGGGSGSGTINTGADGCLAYYDGAGTAVNDATYLVWDDTNNRLGVGSLIPSYKLHVAGTAYAEFNQSLNGFGHNGNNLIDFDGSSNYCQITTNGTERLRIDSSGNVKVGNGSTITASTDADDLVIDRGAADTGLSILSTTTGRIYFGDAANEDAGSIRYVHTDDSMRFETDDIERMRLDSGGNLGIGTDSNGPSETLHTKQTGFYSTFFERDNQTSGTQGWLKIGMSSLGTSGGADALLDAKHYLGFRTNGASTPVIAMTIDDSQRVGIGTTNPKTDLHVSDSAVTGYTSVQNDGVVIERGGGTAALNIATDNDQSGAIWFADGDAANSGQIIYNHSDNSLRLGTAATERMRIASDGVVSLKGGRLVIGEADVASGHIDSFENLTFNIDTDNDDTNRYFSFTYNASAGAGTEVLRITETGLATVKKASNSEVVNQSSGTCDLSASNNFKVTMSGAITINLTGGTTGQSGVVKIISDGSAISFTSSQIKWAGGTVPTPTSTSGAVDILAYYVDGSDIYGQYLTGMA